jgi:hypothetical protein
MRRKGALGRSNGQTGGIRCSISTFSKPIPAVPAVEMSRRLTADVDAWAEAHDTVRSDAIRQLVELGLSSTSSVDPLGAARRDSVEIEDLAVEQIGQLLDPSLPIAERERRIRRLTAGPPEFSDERIDLPLRE